MARALEVLAVVGTRPEAVKVAPVVERLRADPAFRVRLLATGQHRELLSGALASFGLRPDRDLRVMRPDQTPNAVLAAVIAGLDAELSRRAPDVVLVQGDTTSVLGAALAAFHRRVPVAHLEAGLRSGDLTTPFPEELNRIAVDRIASLLLAPTALAARRLREEGRDPRSIYVTGNTVVDALEKILSRPAGPLPRSLSELPEERPIAVVTLHRRESHGAVLRGLVGALARASRRRPDVLWIVPSHPNPSARAPLAALPRRRFRVIPPLKYADFARLLSRCAFAATDSGGIQEEAPSLGVPYLVLRRATERPEALGRWGKLVGVGPRAVEEALVRAAGARKLPAGPNPFGDGKAAARVAAALKHWAGRGPRPRDFSPFVRRAPSALLLLFLAGISRAQAFEDAQGLADALVRDGRARIAAVAAQTEPNALQKHVAFFDRNGDGIVTRSETVAGLVRLGLNLPEAEAAAFAIHLFLGPRTSGSLTDFDIPISRIQLGKHGSDTGVFDAQGRFVPAAFERMFSEFDADRSGSLSEPEIATMIERDAALRPGDKIAAVLEFKLLMRLAADTTEEIDGRRVPALSRKRLQEFYDGSLFYVLAAQRANG